MTVSNAIDNYLPFLTHVVDLAMFCHALLKRLGSHSLGFHAFGQLQKFVCITILGH